MSEIQEVFARRGFKAGDRLPAERELAKLLSVGRSSLREAIHALQTMGFVERRHGVGTFFLAEPGNWSIAALKFQTHSPNTLFEELIETRLLLESRLAALAAERHTPTELGRIRVAARKRAQAAPGEHAELGLDFHLAVAAAAHQTVLLEMLKAVRTLYWDTWNSLDTAAREVVAAFRARQQGGHERILRAIAARDPDAAAEAMRKHLLELRNDFSSILEPSRAAH
ncbi:MAG: FadR family transcriptional regulator [Hyphomicrobiales bacterium]|nr:FadR family transcriptional regulator [Hyphomicrobiales bacterium]